MKKFFAVLLFIAFAFMGNAYAQQSALRATTGGGGSSVTFPTSGDAVISNGTSSPAGVAEVDGDCLVGTSGSWAAGSCGGGAGFALLTSGTNTSAAMVVGAGGSLAATSTGTIAATSATKATELSISGQTGLLSFTGLTSTNRQKTVEDAADTILELGGSYTPTGTWVWTSASATWPTFNQNTTGSAGSVAAANITGATLASSITGSSLTSLGTIGTGVWHGTAIGGSYLVASTTAALGGVSTDGSTITNNAGAISCTTATSSQIGCSKPDGTILTISAGAETVAKASSSAFGVAEVDNTTITASSGVISSVVGAATTNTFTNKTYDTAGTGNVFKINGTQITHISGNTAYAATAESTPWVSGDCVEIDSSGNLEDTGSVCGSGGGGTTSLAGLTTNVLFDANGNMNLGNVTAAHASAIRNTFVGNTSGNLTSSTANTIGNTAVGYGTLAAQTSGGYDTIVGELAGNALTSGADNTAVGYGALEASTTDSTNTAVGYAAFFSLLGSGSISNNVAIGYEAGYTGTATTTGKQDTYVGSSSYGSSATVSNESCFGYGCVGAGTNTVNLGNSSTTTLYLGGTQIGMTNLLHVLSTTNDLNIGSSTAMAASGHNNTFIANYGNNAGNPGSATSATAYNVGIGAAALSDLGSGSDNTAVGGRAGYNLTSGSGDTIVGYTAMDSAQTDGETTAIGESALYSQASAGTTAANVALGYGAGYTTTGCTTCTNSTFIGANAHGSAATTANELVIGEAAAGLGANQTVIGNASTTYTNLEGQLVIAGTTTGTNADFLCLSSAGVVLLQSSSCTISSRRFKENIHPFEDIALAELEKLKVVTFTKKIPKVGKPDVDVNAYRPQIGVIAEDVAKVDKKLAIYEQDGKTPKSYRQESMIALAVKAIQEQQKEIEQLKSEIQELKDDE